MTVSFSSEQVLEATGGRCVRAGTQGLYDSVSTDTRTMQAGCLFVALMGRRQDAHQFLNQAIERGAAGVVVQRGRPLPDLPNGPSLFEVEDTLDALGDLARLHRLRFRIPIGAVAGSNGKTTTKDMIAAILATRGPALKTEGNLNNQVGVPLTLFNLSDHHVAAVVEMGMNRPGEITRLAEIAQPDAGLITVVQPEHLLGLGDIEGVARANGELFRGLRQGTTAVVNLDDSRVAEQAAQCNAKMLTFGCSPNADVRLLQPESLGREGLSLRIAFNGKEHAFNLSLVGRHNALNAAGAFAMGVALGYRPEDCVRGLAAARPCARRLNLLDCPGGFTILDDCYNANPDSMQAALDTLRDLAGHARAVAVLGDMLELGPEETEEHRRLGERVGHVLELVAFFGPRSVHALEATGFRDRAAHFTEIEPLLKWLRDRLLPKDLVLIKGSRGMQMERVVEFLTGKHGAPQRLDASADLGRGASGAATLE